MQFKTLEEFLAYYYKEELKIADIEFNITTGPVSGDVVGDTEEPADDATADGDPTVTPDVIETPPEEEIVDPEGKKLLEHCTLILASGKLDVTFDNEGYMLVDECTMTPNACGTGSVVLSGRKMHLNMCDNNGMLTGYFHTTAGQNQPIKIRRK